MKKRLIFIAAAVIAVTLAVFYGAGLLSSNDGNSQLKTAAVKSGSLRIEVLSTGVVMPEVEVVVKSKAGGEITAFPFNEGELLKKGMTIVTLDPETEQARANQAKASALMTEAKLDKVRIALRDAEMKLNRQKKLFEDGIISRQELDDAIIVFEKAKSDVKLADAEVFQAKEALKEASERLADTAIKAPFDGTILKKFVDAGQVISSSLSSFSEGTPLFSMANLEKIYVSTQVDEVDISKIAQGQEASITVDSLPGKTFSGMVERITPQGEVQRTVTVFKVFVRITDREKSLLLPGMTAGVRILVDLRKDVVLVTNDALRVQNGKTGVYRMQGAEPVWTEIKTGKTDGVVTEVEAGLKDGAHVVTSGMKKPGEAAPKKRFFF